MEPYITKDGREVPLRTVGRRYVDQVRAKHPLPEKPTYTVETAAGDVETHPHQVQKDAEGKITKSTLTTDEDWAAWNAYEQGIGEAISRQYEAMTEFLLYNCINLEPEPVDQWTIDPALWGLDVPDPSDKIAFKTFWLENEYLSDQDDLVGVLARLYAAHGVIKEDRITEFESFFRVTLARLTAAYAAGPAAGRAEDPGA